MAIKPLGERIVMKEVEATKTTGSGLVLAGEKEETQMAEVTAVSEDVRDIAVGDKVYYKKYSGTKVKDEGVEYIIIETENVIAIID